MIFVYAHGLYRCIKINSTKIIGRFYKVNVFILDYKYKHLPLHKSENILTDQNPMTYF